MGGIGRIAGIGVSGGIPGIGLIGPPVAPFTQPNDRSSVVSYIPVLESAKVMARAPDKLGTRDERSHMTAKGHGSSCRPAKRRRGRICRRSESSSPLSSVYCCTSLLYGQ